MKKMIPEQEVEVCDLCGREGFLMECHVCGREFCLSHQGMVPATYGFTTICVECADREDVRAVCIEYARKLVPIYQERNGVLKRLVT